MLWSYLPFVEIVGVDDEGWGLELVIVSDVRALPGWSIVVVLQHRQSPSVCRFCALIPNFTRLIPPVVLSVSKP